MNHNKPKLSPKKRKFIEYLKYKDYKNPVLSNIRKEIGISKSTFYRWLRDEKLSDITEEENDVNTEEHIHEVEVTLLEKARQGDVRAIKLFFERYEAVKKSKKKTPEQLIREAQIRVRNKRLGLTNCK